MSRRRRRASEAPRAHRPIEHFRSRLGHRFRNLGLLKEALTHGSYANDYQVEDYERLEFVGDAALGLVVTEIVHFDSPSWSLHRRQEVKSSVVNNESLAAAARSLQLPDGLRVGRGQAGEQGARTSDRILANVFEAVLGAAWLDGGLDAVRRIVSRAFARRFRSLGLDPAKARRSPSPMRALLTSLALLRGLLRLTTPTERALRYAFRRPELFRTATEPAATPSTRRASGRHRARRRRGHRREAGNMDWLAQRFLGRDVLHLLIADSLHRHFPEWDEGRMTLARMRFLEKDFLLRLGVDWRIADSQTSAAIVEALLGALYLDGGFRAAGRALRSAFDIELAELEKPDLELLDPKTLLQNRIAQSGGDPPAYRELSNPGGGRVAVSLRLPDGQTFRGIGRGIKEAEKNAAAKACSRLFPDHKEPANEKNGGKAGRPQTPGAKDASRPENPKGTLQEWMARERKVFPTYRVISEDGPEHDKTFHVEVLVDGRALARGSGPSKRSAEAEAAATALAERRQ